MSFSKVAAKYAHGVVSGEIPAGKWVKAACQRQIDDLESPPLGFHFSIDHAEKVCRFVELCPHIKGAFARQKQMIRLEPWQVFYLTTVFGWVNDKGNRRFRRSYGEIPRGNAKSTLSSCVGLFMLGLDGEAGSEVYSAATTRDQARIVFRDSQAMARKMPAFTNRFGIEVIAQAITQLKTSSSFKALSADGNTLDGLNIHMGIIDELHAHKTRDVYDVIETGCGKRDQSLLWTITTAGNNKHGICYEVRDYIQKILSGEIKDSASEGTFGIIYTIDEGDDPYSEEALRKANPNWGVSVDPVSVLQVASKAYQVATARPNYLTKHLNVWVDANHALFDTEHWKKCADSGLDETEFEKDECVIALDLASKIDVAAKINIYRRKLGEEDHYYIFPKLFLPQAAIDESRHPMYPGWAMHGHFDVMVGETVDYAHIETELRLEATGRNIQAVVVDPWQAQYLIQNLQKDKFPAHEMRQTVANMSEPTKELDALMRQGRVHHTDNAVLNWMIGNVVGHYDAKENVYPRKEMDANKIDGAVAIIMALGWFLQNRSKPPSIYERRALLLT